MQVLGLRSEIQAMLSTRNWIELTAEEIKNLPVKNGVEFEIKYLRHGKVYRGIAILSEYEGIDRGWYMSYGDNRYNLVDGVVAYRQLQP